MRSLILLAGTFAGGIFGYLALRRLILSLVHREWAGLWYFMAWLGVAIIIVTVGFAVHGQPSLPPTAKVIAYAVGEICAAIGGLGVAIDLASKGGRPDA